METVEAALAGASDIIAEEISDSAELRKVLKRLIAREGQIKSAAASEEDSVYSLYYEFARPVSKLQGHQADRAARGGAAGVEGDGVCEGGGARRV